MQSLDVTRRRRNVLHIACSEGHLELVKQLALAKKESISVQVNVILPESASGKLFTYVQKF